MLLLGSEGAKFRFRLRSFYFSHRDCPVHALRAVDLSPRDKTHLGSTVVGASDLDSADPSSILS